MKTRELIKMLQEVDPGGEAEVVVENRPIHFAEALPAYYDGRMHCLIQDPSISTYNVIGYKITGEGRKVRLNLLDLEDVILHDHNLPVDLSELDVRERAEWEELVTILRQEAILEDSQFDQLQTDKE